MGARSRVGELLVGKYRLEYRLGSGGVGEVYRARNELIGRVVAIKMLRKERASDRVVMRRFMQEARAANLVKHPNVVDVLDVDQDQDGVPFIVQEFLDGTDLGQYLRDNGGTISHNELLEFMIPIVEAVATAHDAGVVHRDLKPENVFLANIDGRIVPKLLDFGISYMQPSPNQVRVTRTGTTVGTPAYMAPEQVEGTTGIDGRTDIWALGVIMYEALAGRLPFDGATPAMLFAQIAWVTPTDLAEVAPNVPRDLARVVMRCLRRDPSERYQTALELAHDLRLIAKGLPLEFGSRPTAAPPETETSRQHQQRSSQQQPAPSPPPPRMQAPSLVISESAPPPSSGESDGESLADELLAPIDEVSQAGSEPVSAEEGLGPSSGLEVATLPPPGQSHPRLRPPSPQEPAVATGPHSAASVEDLRVETVIRGMLVAAVALSVVGMWHFLVDQDIYEIRSTLKSMSVGERPGTSLVFGVLAAGGGIGMLLAGLRTSPRLWALVVGGGSLILAGLALGANATGALRDVAPAAVRFAFVVAGLGAGCAVWKKSWTLWNEQEAGPGQWKTWLLAFGSGTVAFVGYFLAAAMP